MIYMEGGNSTLTMVKYFATFTEGVPWDVEDDIFGSKWCINIILCTATEELINRLWKWPWLLDIDSWQPKLHPVMKLEIGENYACLILQNASLEDHLASSIYRAVLLLFRDTCMLSGFRSMQDLRTRSAIALKVLSWYQMAPNKNVWSICITHNSKKQKNKENCHFI